MANKLQIKRTSLTGVTPNTTNSGNTAYIDAGELAINMADSKLFTANTTGGLLELGSNLSSLTVTSIYANGTVGSTGKVLTTNGSGIYWGDSSPAAATLSASLEVFTFTISSNTTIIEGTSDEITTLAYEAGLESVFINGSRQILGTDYAATNASAITLTSNVIAGDVVQVATFNATSAEQATYTYTVSSNTTVFSGADDQAANLQYVSGLESVFINGSRQVAGVDYNSTNSTAFTLTSNAIAGDVVQLITWTDITNTTNTSLEYVWTNTHSFSNTVTFAANVQINGKIIPNVQSITSNSTITPNANTNTQVSVTALAEAATIAVPSGTASDGQSLVIRIKDNGTDQALTWTTGSSGAFRAVGITLPTTTVANKTIYIGFKYNSTDLRWDAIALSQEA